MDFEREISRRLHREHLDAIGLSRRLGTYLRDNPAERPPQPAPFLTELAGALEREIGPHFGFEDAYLFPRLDESGETELVAVLGEEHEVIRPLADEITALARGAIADGWSERSWARFHALGRDLVERLVAHIQKETMALLPAVEEAIDADADRELSAAYAEA